MKKTPGLFLCSLIVLGLLILSGCSTADPSSNQPSDPPSAPPEVDPSPTPNAPDPTPTEIPSTEGEGSTDSEPIQQDQPISASGPWVVYTAYNGVFISNSDGGGLNMLHPFQMVDPYVSDSKIRPAPQGGRIALLELINIDGSSLRFPNLKVIKVPSGEIELDLPLIPEDWEESDFVDPPGFVNTVGTRAVDQVFAATGVWNNLTWSHDGTMLAFNAAIDGPSADLYVYHTSDGSVVRLTSGGSQSVDPVFTPDDQYIVHGAVATLNYGASGGGYDYLHIWAARSNGEGVHKVSDRQIYGYEHVLGWLSDSEYLAASSEAWCLSFDLRVIDVHDGEGEMLLSGNHNLSVFAPERDQVLFYVDDYLAGVDCQAEISPGVYLLDVNTSKQVQVNGIDPNLILTVFWQEQAEKYFIFTERDLFYLVDPQGTVTEYPAPAERRFRSPAGQPRWRSLGIFG